MKLKANALTFAAGLAVSLAVSAVHAQNKPFFLYLAYNAPHFPFEAPAEDAGKVAG